MKTFELDQALTTLTSDQGMEIKDLAATKGFQQPFLLCFCPLISMTRLASLVFY